MLYDAVILLSALCTILNVVLYWRSELLDNPQLLYLVLLGVFAIPATVLLLGRRRWRGTRQQRGCEILHCLPAEMDVRYPIPFETPPHLSVELRWKRAWGGGQPDPSDSEDPLPECRVVEQRGDGFKLRVGRAGLGERDRLHVGWKAVGTPVRCGRRP